MKISITRSISSIALALSMLMFYSSPASAQYDFQIVIPPGAEYVQVFGINNAGKVVGGGSDGSTDFSFEYDMKTGKYSTIDDGFGALEINNSGVMVGDLDGYCAIRDKRGMVTFFTPPSYTTGSVCQARGINSKGKVSGYQLDADGVWSGFIYDSNQGTFEEFLPSAQTIAHGINSKGQNVGSVYLAADAAFPGSAPGRYGYRRETDGSVTYFSISQGFPGQSRARGISDSGLVTGFYIDSGTFEIKSFVTPLSNGTDFENITLTDDQLVYQKPCNVDVPAPEGYDVYTDMTASQIRNDGVIVGSCFDYYFNETTGDLIDYVYGFIATPTK